MTTLERASYLRTFRDHTLFVHTRSIKVLPNGCMQQSKRRTVMATWT